MREYPSRRQSLKTIEIEIGGEPVPVADVAVCPVTGQPLVRTVARAVECKLNPASYAAKEIPASNPPGDLPAGPVTLVHPELVDVKKLR